MNDSVCGVIVTYNRKEYLEKLLMALKSQTHSLKAVLIFDNNSTDGTAEMLLKSDYCKGIESGTLYQNDTDFTTYYYFRNKINSGGSGGFHDAIEIASKLEYDYIWTMDDDVLPEKNCLEELLKYMSREVRVCIPSRTDKKFLDYAITDINMSNPFLYHITSRKTRVKSTDIKEKWMEVQDMPFEGPLLDVSIIREVGLPKAEFFIIFDDTEYALRMSKKTKLYFIPSAVLHKQIIPVTKNHGKMGWKEFYGYRNQFWFDRTYGENIFVKYFRPVFLVIELSLKAIIKRKWINLKVIFWAYRDGVQGKLGKRVEPGREFQYK